MEAANAEQIRTALYRYFDPDGKLLYVGISLSPTYRQSQHRDSSHWYERIETMRVQWFDCRRDALDAERAAIKAECPECNVMHNRTVSAIDARMEQLADESRAELTQRVTRYQPAYAVKAAGDSTGVGETSIRWAMAAGDLPYYPTGHNTVAISGWALIAYVEALQAGQVAIRKAIKLEDGRVIRPPSGEWLVNNVGNVSIEAWTAYLLELWSQQESVAA